MQLLHLAHGRVFGGIEQTILAMMLVQSDAMRCSSAVCFGSRLSDHLRASGAACHVLGEVRASRPWTVLAARRQLARLIRSESIDVVIAHGNWSHGLFGGVVRDQGARLVAMAHAPYGSRHWTERLAVRQGADLVLANSRYTAASVPVAFPNTRCEVLHPALRFDHLDTPAAGRDSLRRELGVASDEIIVLMASRLDFYKGHEVFIAAAARLQQRVSCKLLRFVVAGGPQGDGEAKRFQLLQRTATNSGVSIKWLGQRTDVPALMSASDVYCQPNVGPEPFGLSFVEALRSGLAVVTSRIGGAVEIVNDRVGILTEPGDVASVAEAIASLAENPGLRQRMSRDARETGRVLCVPEVQLKRLRAILEINFAMASGGSC